MCIKLTHYFSKQTFHPIIRGIKFWLAHDRTRSRLGTSESSHLHLCLPETDCCFCVIPFFISFPFIKRYPFLIYFQTFYYIEFYLRRVGFCHWFAGIFPWEVNNFIFLLQFYFSFNFLLQLYFPIEHTLIC